MDGKNEEDYEAMLRLSGIVYRLYGCLRAYVGRRNSQLGLAPLEALTIGTVAYSPQPLTVAQIGRIHNYPRQSIQRSANSLAEAGLIEIVSNPRHARAPLLAATSKGLRIADNTLDNIRELAQALSTEFPAERASVLADDLLALFLAVDREQRQIAAESGTS
ncbi:MAG: MarR family winged helix-turn-helix transcriptional regulator [Novosphingobium sp.]